MLNGSCVHPLHRQGQKRPPKEVARVPQVLVRAVLAPGDPAATQDIPQKSPPQGEERPKKKAPPLGHPNTSTDPRTAYEVEEHRLRHVVPIVPKGDPHGAAVLRRKGQGLIPQSPGGGLERLPSHPPPGHVDACLAETDSPSGGHPPHEGRIRIGLRPPNAVIHMYGQDGASVKRPEKPQERQGIPAPRDCRQNGPLGRKPSLTPSRLEKKTRQRMQRKGIWDISTVFPTPLPGRQTIQSCPVKGLQRPFVPFQFTTSVPSSRGSSSSASSEDGDADFPFLAASAPP